MRSNRLSARRKATTRNSAKRKADRNFFEPLESRRHLSGITLVANTWDSTLGTFALGFANNLTNRVGGANNCPWYRLNIGLDGNGNLTVSSFSHFGNTGTNQSSPVDQAVLYIDYSGDPSGASNPISTSPKYPLSSVANVVTNWILNNSVDGMNLASSQIHLMDESRSVSLMDDIAKNFGQAGIWVDNETYMDPHPIYGIGDPVETVYNNVAFADNYWRTNNQPETGVYYNSHPVNGAFNLELPFVQANSAGYGTPHVAPSGYYNATVDLNSTQEFGPAYGAPVYDAWWGTTPDHPPRNATGFYYSDYVGGQRPASGSWSLTGGNGARTDPGQSGAQWPNVTGVATTNGNSFSSGQQINLNFLHQDRGANSTVTFSLDTDQNPINNNFAKTLGSMNFGASGSGASDSFSGSTSGVNAGTYWICATITDGQGHTRYDYSQPITISGSSSPTPTPTPAPTPTPTPTSTPVTGAVNINAGGGAGGTFLADTNFTGGNTFTTTSSIDTSKATGAATQSVFQSERYGNFTYTYTGLTANAPYTVQLDFSENYFNGPAKRLFNTSINGTNVLSNYDIFSAAGGEFKAVTPSFNTTADSNGNITISFTGVTDNAKVDGIELSAGATPTPRPTPTPTPIPTPTPNPTPTPTSTVVQIDAGGGAVGSFVSDTGFSGGSTFSVSTPVDTSAATNPAPQAVYQTERYGNFSYTVPNLTPGSQYAVQLDFAELYWGAANQRVFNVAINGVAALSNFDIFAAAMGKNKAISRSFIATADTSGKITISFSSRTDNAKVDGIEISAASSKPPVVQIDSGGPASGSFAADSNVTGGTAFSTTAAINTSGVTNPAPQNVYQTERYGNFTYSIPGLTAGAAYSVRLDFAELFWNAAGQRLFNVLINGSQVLTKFDIFATAGGSNKAVAETFNATADSGGKITIQFAGVQDNAKVSAIEISPA